MRNVLNFAAFQCCWFANVLGAASGVPWLGPLLTVLWIAGHFAALRGAATPGDVTAEARLLLAAIAVGWTADSTLALSGVIGFPEIARLGGPSPVWMVALWVCFAATLRHSLGWLRARWLLAAALGAIGGPLAYLGGETLGAILLLHDFSVAAVSLQYAIATPVLLFVAHHAKSPRHGESAMEVPDGTD